VAEPQKKANAIDALINSISGNDRVTSIKTNKCALRSSPNCDGTVNKFKDAISAREYTISGMCQACQDGFFGGSNEN